MEPAPARPADVDTDGRVDAAVTAFRRFHGTGPSVVWSAPGRVNLIGEHTDYNGGLALPFALPHRTTVAARRRDDDLLTVTGLTPSGRVRRATLDADRRHRGRVTGWAAHVAGAAWALVEAGLDPGGADLVVTGDVPIGAGLSSSAALGVAVVSALGVLADPDVADVPRHRVIDWARRAENDYLGSPTGTLDQTAVLYGLVGHATRIDFAVPADRPEHVRPVPCRPRDHSILVIDTRVRRSHTTSDYARRRADCDRAAGLLGLPSLSAIPVSGMDDHLRALPPDLVGLARHVVTENARVDAAVAALSRDLPVALGVAMTASHTSLRDDYRVSCPELDLAVDTALAAGAAGARMTGGGFGGCAIALVADERLDRVRSAVTAAFTDAGLDTPRLFTVTAAAGAGRDR